MMNREPEKSTDIKDNAADKVSKASEFVQKTEDKVNEQIEDYSKTVSEYIKNCPIRSVLAASVAGFLFGLLIKNN